MVGTSILTVLRLVVTGFRARKKTLRRKSVLGSMIPASCDTEKSSPRFSSPVRCHATGSSVAFRIVSVFVSFLSQIHSIPVEAVDSLQLLDLSKSNVNTY